MGLKPLESLLDQSKLTRQCHKCEDLAHLKSGIGRVLHFKGSGRAWGQDLGLYFDSITFDVGNFFDALKSQRRLNYLKEMDALLAAQADARILNYGADPFAADRCRSLNPYYPIVVVSSFRIRNNRDDNDQSAMAFKREDKVYLIASQP